MKIDRKIFFEGIRGSPMPKKLKASQVFGIEAILNEWERRQLTDLRWLAYILATPTIETGWTFKPIKEWGGEKYLRSKKYWPWIGRGFVQITWKDNYVKFHKRVLDKFGVDILKNPDAVMNLDVALFIMFEGMINGEFTGKALKDYFNKNTTDWIQARRIINRLDRAAEIGGYAKQFYADLVLATGAKV